MESEGKCRELAARKKGEGERERGCFVVHFKSGVCKDLCVCVLKCFSLSGEMGEGGFLEKENLLLSGALSFWLQAHTMLCGKENRKHGLVIMLFQITYLICCSLVTESLVLNEII